MLFYRLLFASSALATSIYGDVPVSLCCLFSSVWGLGNRGVSFCFRYVSPLAGKKP